MWTALHGDGPDEGFFRRISAPENEIPVALPLNTLLARTGDVAIALVGLQVHTTGLSFGLVVRMRPGAVPPRRLDPAGRRPGGRAVAVGPADAPGTATAPPARRAR